MLTLQDVLTTLSLRRFPMEAFLNICKDHSSLLVAVCALYYSLVFAINCYYALLTAINRCYSLLIANPTTKNARLTTGNTKCL